jgi:hypothetical protein
MIPLAACVVVVRDPEREAAFDDSFAVENGLRFSAANSHLQFPVEHVTQGSGATRRRSRIATGEARWESIGTCHACQANYLWEFPGVRGHLPYLLGAGAGFRLWSLCPTTPLT